MKRRVLSLLLILALIGGMAPAQAAGKKISHSDEGFVQDVQQVPISGGHYMETATPEGGMVLSIGSAADFEKIRSAPAECYVLTNDIDLGEWAEPFAFSGVLVGNGHTISYRSSGRMNQGDHFACGLFTKIDRAYIENLCVQAVIDDSYADVSGAPVYIGGIAAQAGNGAYLNNCVVNAKITVSTVQWLDSERTKHEAVCAVDTAALGTGSAQTAVGGMIGYIEAGTDASIYACRSTGMIAGADCTGGLIGQSEGIVSMLGCENRAAVSGVICVGGLIGSASGECYIAQSGNRGEIIAYSAYAGGLAGSVTCFANDSIKDCANVGTVICGALDGKGKYAGGIAGNAACAVLRCVNMAKIVGQDPQPYVGNTENARLWENTVYTFDEDEDFETILDIVTNDKPNGYVRILNLEMVWSLETDLLIPYPRLLCGDTLNQYQAAYVESLIEIILKFDTTLNQNLSRNMASRLGTHYREGMHNEVNTAWSAIMSLSKVLDFDLSAFDDLAKYDALICDLMLSKYMYDSSQARVERSVFNTVLDYSSGVLQGVGDLASYSSAGLEFATEIVVKPLWFNLNVACTHLDKLRDVQELSDDMRKMYKNKYLAPYYYAEHGTMAGKDALSLANIMLTYFNVYQNMHSETEMLNAAYDVYNGSYETIGRLMKDLVKNARKGRVYPEQIDANTNLSLLASAIEDFQKNAVNNNEHPMLSQIGADLGDHLFGLLSATGAWAEFAYLEKLAKIEGCEWLGKLGLYKAAITIGRGVNTFIGNEDYAYNGNLLDCSGYMADMLQPLVWDAYEAFMEDQTYENAIYFHDAVMFYLSLQVLACDYGEKMTNAGLYDNEDEKKALEDLKVKKDEMIKLLEAFSDY